MSGPKITDTQIISLSEVDSSDLVIRHICRVALRIEFDYRPAHNQYGTIAFAEPRSRAEAGPGARYARTVDFTTVDQHGRHLTSYWRVVSGGAS